MPTTARIPIPDVPVYIPQRDSNCRDMYCRYHPAGQKKEIQLEKGDK
jgi:hypothetical protein